MNRLTLLIASAAFLALTLFGNQGLLRLIQLKKMEHALDQEGSALIRQNREMAEEVQRLSQTDYLERLIRQERGYVRDGEILVELPNSP